MNEHKKVALVTGSSRGIGFAIAKLLGENGYEVVIVARKSAAEYPEQVAILKDSGIAYQWICGDVGDGEDRVRMVAETMALCGRIDVLVNNAGVAPRERNDLLDMSEEDYDYVVDTNTKSNMFLTQAVAKHMIAQPQLHDRKGVVVNISSCSSEVVSVNRGAYCVSKAGISMLTKLYAKRLAPEDIFVYEVRPGVIETDMTKGVSSKYDDLIAQGLFPIARWGKPEDVAQAVLQFCSGAFSYTTGSHIDVDGGFHIRSL